MFGFGKKEDKAPEKRLADLQRKKDWAGVSRTYYEPGVAAMDAGDLHKARRWLQRADAIYSADDMQQKTLQNSIAIKYIRYSM